MSEYALASDPGLIDLLERLRAAYSQRRFSVINLIYSRPLEKIRDLADAFVIGAPSGPKRDDKK